MSRTFEGRGISAGIGIGVASVLPDLEMDYPGDRIQSDDVEAELEKFHRALERARRTTGRIREETRETHHESIANLFSVQGMVLEDPLLIDGTEARIRKKQLPAESAVIRTMREITDTFVQRTRDTAIQAREVDIMDAGWRILRHLDTSVFSPRLPQGGVLVARKLTPSMAVRLEEEGVEGLVVQNVDRSSHIAVITQAMEIPAVGILEDSFYRTVEPGTNLIVGANQNRVILDPGDEVLEAHRRARSEYREFTQRLRDTTREVGEDQLPLSVRSNIGFLSELPMVERYGGFGAGLVRTELLFMGESAEYPSEESQQSTYRRIVRDLKPHPATLRTFDVGGDKRAFEEELMMPGEQEAGRGLHRSFDNEDAFRTQLRAMLKVHEEHGNVRILLPMVGTSQEVHLAREILESLADSEGLGVPPVGVIVEIPSLVFMLEELTELVDFLSVGTNDLMYYLIGADRFAWESTDYVDLPDPTLLRCVRRVADRAHGRSLSVGVCGELAGSPLFTPVFVGLGLTELSMSPIRIPEVKFVASRCEIEEARAMARESLDLTGRDELVDWVRSRLSPYVWELFEASEVGKEGAPMFEFERRGETS